MIVQIRVDSFELVRVLLQFTDELGELCSWYVALLRGDFRIRVRCDNLDACDLGHTSRVELAFGVAGSRPHDGVEDL